MKIQVFKGGNKQWYFRFRSRNGKIVAQSEGYKKRQSCEKTACMLRADIKWGEVDVEVVK